jgi:hypothetical protein
MARKASPPAADKVAKPRAKRTTTRKTPTKFASATAVADPPKRRKRAVKPTAEQIRARAYELYLARGGRGGDPEADWLQAEQELRAQT